MLRFGTRIGMRAAAAAAGGVAAFTTIAAQSHPPAEARSSANTNGTLVMSGDCGGTNTRLVLFRIKDGAECSIGKPPEGDVVFAKKYLNSTFIDKGEGFKELCQTFLKEAGGAQPLSCCLACAGGITNNSVNFTNVGGTGWKIDGDGLSKVLGIPKVKLINDFEAQGYGLLTLGPDEVRLLNNGTKQEGKPIACVGAGTGLGECYLTMGTDGKYTCYPSEGGHAEFSPRSELTMRLLEYLKDKFRDRNDYPKRVSVERVVSGVGLANIYEFLRSHWAFSEFVTKGIDGEFLGAGAMQGAIVAKGASEGDYVCAKAVDIFSECYGSEAGVAALKWLPYGGLYISGGIAAKNPHWVASETFLHAYADKGRLSPLVESVPVYLVLTEDTGERGALYMAVRMLTDP